MSVFIIANIKITDESWVADYAANVHSIVHKHGGKYLARSGNIKVLEGEAQDMSLVALLEFPDAKKAESFINDSEYAPFAMARQQGSESYFQMIDNTDLAGTISYLPAA